MGDKIYKIAILGCGRISHKHIKAVIENSNKIRLIAVCDLSRNHAENKAKQYCDALKPQVIPEIYDDYKEMIDLEEPDIVSICTESGYHAEHAIYCMNKGKHVIVEKPMALSTKDADEMIAVAKKNNVKLCVCHQNRFNPPIQKLRKALESGRFGKLIAGNARILWNRSQDYYNQAPWRGTYELDGGCLMNQCIHNIDLLQWMLDDDIQWIHGVVENYLHPYIEAEDYGSIQIKFKKGAIGNVEGTVCVCPKNLEETLTIIGTCGTVVIGGLAVNKVLTWRFEDGLDSEDEIITECNEEIDSVYGDGHTPLYRDMAWAIENNQEPYVNGEAGKKAVEIILAAYKSSQEGKRVSYPIEEIKSIDFKEKKDERI